MNTILPAIEIDSDIFTLKRDKSGVYVTFMSPMSSEIGRVIHCVHLDFFFSPSFT